MFRAGRQGGRIVDERPCLAEMGAVRTVLYLRACGGNKTKQNINEAEGEIRCACVYCVYIASFFTFLGTFGTFQILLLLLFIMISQCNIR